MAEHPADIASKERMLQFERAYAKCFITDEQLARQALRRLLEARDLLKLIGAKRTEARVRAAISSCRGAVRHAPNRKTSNG